MKCTLKPPLRRQNSFDALRLLFALFVIFNHSYALLLLPDPLEVISGFRYDFGKLGVTGFFAISGYLVTQSWLRNPNPFRFVLARALRIFPAFWVALLFSVLIAATVTTNAYEFLSGPYTWRWVSRNALFIWQGFGTGMPGAFEGNPFPGGANGSLWTLTYELRCYAVVLLLGMTTLLAQRRLMWVVIAALTLYYFKSVMNIGLAFRLGYYDLYLAFATGMLIASSGYRSSIISIAGVSLCAMLAQLNHLPGDHWWYAPLQMAIAVVIVRLANSQTLMRFAFRSGDYSYGLYVYAFPLQQLVIALLGDYASPFLVCLLTLASTFPLAILSWHSLEKRALRWLQTISIKLPFTKKPIPTGQP